MSEITVSRATGEDQVAIPDNGATRQTQLLRNRVDLGNLAIDHVDRFVVPQHPADRFSDICRGQRCGGNLI